MKSVEIWAVGRPGKLFDRAAAHYLKLCSRYVDLREGFVRDAPGKLSVEERRRTEGRAIAAKLPPDARIVCLDERGQALDSVAFSTLLTGLIEGPGRPAFVIGGPQGLSDELRDRAEKLLSLSAMTLPHELARVVLLEQIYRGLAIARGLPYHNP